MGGGGGGMGMSGSSMYTEASDYGVASSGGQNFGAMGGAGSGASLGLSVPSAGSLSSTPAADTRVSTQVRRRGQGMGSMGGGGADALVVVCGALPSRGREPP